MFKSFFCKSFLLCVIPCLLVCALFTGCTSLLSEGSTETTMKTETAKTGEDAPFACDPSALSKEQKERYKTLTAQLKANHKEVKELPDGYALRFDSTMESIRDTAEFITYERECCPFFDFEMVVEKNEGSLWLNLRGREGVKDFIRTEFGI